MFLQQKMGREVVIDVNCASYNYEYKDGTRTPGLVNCSVKFQRGDRVVLMGANGSGKSTLLGTIAGMHKCTEGKVTVLGSDAFTDCSLQQRVARIGAAWPDNANWCETVRQTAATYPQIDWHRFDSLCKVLHVNPEWRVDHCSSGMKRKIQVLLGLIYPKQILGLDEFSADLDVVEREHILNYLREESEKNQVTVLYATHIFDNLGDWPTHLLRMSQGRYMCVGCMCVVHGKALMGSQFIRVGSAPRGGVRARPGWVSRLFWGEEPTWRRFAGLVWSGTPGGPPGWFRA